MGMSKDLDKDMIDKWTHLSMQSYEQVHLTAPPVH